MKTNNKIKEIEIKYILMTNKELTKEFIKDTIEGAKGAGNDMDDFKIVNGETYKIKK